MRHCLFLLLAVMVGGVLPGGNRYAEPCGGRFDFGPEETVPPHPQLWEGPWHAEQTGPLALCATSANDPTTGVQLARDFVLDADTSRLRCTQTVRNISAENKRYAYWGRTFVTGGGICLVPLTPGSRFPRGYIEYTGWFSPQIVMKPADPAIIRRDDFLIVDREPKDPKLGLDSTAGWFAYWAKANLLFVRRFPVDRNRRYADVAGLTVSLYFQKDMLAEREKNI